MASSSGRGADMDNKQQDLQLVYRDVEELLPYANNARVHMPAQVEKVAASIRRFGFINPVIIDGASGILGGHCRVPAAQLLGTQCVPCIEAAHLTKNDRRACILADIKLVLNSSWDFDLLRVELELYIAHNLTLAASSQATTAMGGAPGQAKGALISNAVDKVSSRLRQRFGHAGAWRVLQRCPLPAVGPHDRL